ncbi:peptidyl-glycine alpha-amidating monooxygenase isoform X1 [Hypomesus transpacificus]|uniref:peptidyl-glycine alpha-amidating monooxygenase isoform X1 n=2 Tax=Hypomesus transpacificus TaxID=137520 RepID=UPI001F0880F8|nr:peptidyl-glycine alpha-amidating monooxygenase isoform X1 [Hypomesus transpacificus]XP_046906348.1 peptidyl-glycine alpha-amidating monooxygenase isoform X1 [Hypomesus transpacificus]XP_046906349.1 peptidyl-glycine alpha-amidating monooxygenase isoform X1 [Hypomesus transpacificus]
MGVLLCSLLVLALVCQSHSSDSSLHRFKRYQEGPQSGPSDCTRGIQPPVVMANSHNFSLDVRMPGVSPTTSDSYLCVAVPVPTSRDAYIVDFVPHASMDTAHHMLLYGCRTPVSTTGYWDCGSAQGTCEDDGAIMYAWARNAPPTKLPRDVGFKVGGKSKITYFVLQIHYGDISAFRDHHKDCSGLTLRMTSKPQPFIAGMYLMMSVDTVIPPGSRVTNADIACEYDSYPMYPFAFRTHTHRLGQVVSGYRIRDGKWTLIGRQSPQLPQAFYAATQGVDVRYGDTIASRCVFTGEGRTSKTYIGGTSNDEMCNFYIMYYMDNKHADPFMDCMQDGSKELFRHIPSEANVPIPVSPDNMMTMMHSGHHATGHQDDMTLLEPKRAEEEILDQGYHLEEVMDWPENPLQLGQVSGLALDSDNNLVIFQRGDHQWGVNSFDNQARYQQRSLGPIQQSTILVIDPVKGNVLKASGRNIFYLPHGITTDAHNNYWVTDVALHQVFKVGNKGKDKPLVVLGEAFEPGSDKEHFCKPTDVAVDTMTGNVYISDGYCNARVLKFSPEGKYLSHWGAGSSDRRRRLPFRIPHSLAFLPDRRELCVADRENGRIQCFVAESGEFVKEIKKEEFGEEVFAIAYTPAHGGLIYAVNGESPYGRSAPLSGFVINYSSKEILDTYSPDSQEFKMPHDIVVNKDGAVFVGDAASDSVIKFTSEKAEHRSVKKGGIEVQEIEETETFVQTNLKPVHTVSFHVAVASQQKPPEVLTQEHHHAPESPPPPKSQQQQTHEEDKQKVKTIAKQSARGVSPAVISTLLLIPVVVVISIGLFIRWRKSRMYGDGCEVKLEPNSAGGILGKLRGKAAGSLNLGNFFATHKGYSRQGFDRLSTEGSDQEKDDEDATDSENEEYSAPPPPVPSSTS